LPGFLRACGGLRFYSSTKLVKTHVYGHILFISYGLLALVFLQDEKPTMLRRTITERDERVRDFIWIRFLFLMRQRFSA